MGANPNIPGGEHHPCLVVGRNINIEERRARLIVAYGTSTTKDKQRAGLDLIIGTAEFAQHGLDCPTRFDLADVNVLDLQWAEEWFSKPRSRPAMIIGKLTDATAMRLKAIREWRKANNRTD